METIAGREIRTTIALDGEQAFRRSLQSLDRELGVMRAELNTLSSTYNENAESVEALAERQRLMQNIVENNQRRFEAMRGAVEDSNRAYGQAVEELERLKAEFGENSEEAQRQANIVRRAEEQLDRYRRQVADTENQLNRSRSELREFNAEFNEENNIDETSDDIETLQQTLEQARERLTQFRERVEKVAETMKKGATIFKNVTTTVTKLGLKATEISFKPATVSLEAFAKTSTTAISVATKAVAGYATAITGAGVAMLATVEETKEYRADLAKLETASNLAGNSFDVMKEQMFEVSVLTGEADASIEALNNLMATELSDSQITEAVEALSGAVVKFPDTLKIEALADGLQETIATGAGAGTFAELIERLGYNLDDFNAGLAECVDWTERQNYAMEFLADTGLAKINEEYRKANAETLNYEKQQLRLTDATAKLGEAFEPVKASITGYGADFLNIFADMIKGTENGTDELKQKVDEFVDDITRGTTTYLPKITGMVTDILEALGENLSTNLPKIVDEAIPVLIKSTENLAKSIIKTLPTFAPKIVESGVKMLKGLITSINEVLDELLPILPGLIEDIGDVLIENAPTILDSAVEMFSKIAEAVTTSSSTITDKIPELVSTFSDTLLNGTTNGKSNIQNIIDAGFDLLISVGQGISKSIPKILEELPAVITSIVTEMTKQENLATLINTGMDIVKAIATGLPQSLVAIASAVPEVTKQIIETFMETDWIQLGIDIVTGILEGMEQAFHPETGIKVGIDPNKYAVSPDIQSQFQGLEFAGMQAGNALEKYGLVGSDYYQSSNSTSNDYSTSTNININIANANMENQKSAEQLAQELSRQIQLQNSAIGK